MTKKARREEKKKQLLKFNEIPGMEELLEKQRIRKQELIRELKEEWADDPEFVKDMISFLNMPAI